MNYARAGSIHGGGGNMPSNSNQRIVKSISIRGGGGKRPTFNQKFPGVSRIGEIEVIEEEEAKY